MTARARWTFEICLDLSTTGIMIERSPWVRIASSWRSIDDTANATALYLASNAKAGVEVAVRLVRVASGLTPSGGADSGSTFK